MKYYLFLVLTFLFMMNCSNPDQTSDEQTTDATEEESGEITAESMEAYRQQLEEEGGAESYRGLQDGNYYQSWDIKRHLSTFGAATQYNNEDKIVFISITKSSLGDYRQACEYDQAGTYTILNGNNVDGESILDGIEYPILEHNSTFRTLYKIEEIDISQNGYKISMDVRKLDFSEGTYGEDMAIPKEHANLMVTEQGQLVLMDHVYDEGNQQYYMSENEAGKLDETECDENPELESGTVESPLTALNIKYGNSGDITDREILVTLLNDMDLLSIDGNSTNELGRATEESGEYVVYSSFVGARYFVKDEDHSFSEASDISTEDYPILIDRYQMTDIYKIESMKVEATEVEIEFSLLEEEEPTEKTDNGYRFTETFTVVDNYWVMSDHQWDHEWIDKKAREGFKKVSDD